MQRIIDGILYDTTKSDFICGFTPYRGYSPSKQKSSHGYNYYITKNGIIFFTYRNDLFVTSEEAESGVPVTPSVIEVKRRMKPSIYKKYFDLVVPGEKVKQIKQTKRLDTIE